MGDPSETADGMALVVKGELRAGRTFHNLHGITSENIERFLIEPFRTLVDPDDLESTTWPMWAVLRLDRVSSPTVFVLYDPLSSQWAIAEGEGEVEPQTPRTALVWADSLAGALDAM